MSRRAIFGFSALLLSAALSPPAPVLAQEARTIVTTENGDYFGFDLRTVQDVTLDQCKTDCIDDLSCRAFTYNPKAKWCFLKSDFNQLNTFSGAVAGRIALSDGQPDIGAAPALPFIPDYLLRDARTFRDGLALAPEHEGQGAESLASLGRIETASGRIDQALIAYKGALALAPDDYHLWIETAEAAGRAANNSYLARQGALAALNAYQLSRTTDRRAKALAVLADTLDKSSIYRAGLDAYKASLALSEDAAVRSAYLGLRARRGFRVVNHTIDSDSATPRACVEFSEPLVKAGADYASFVTLDGAAPKAVEAKDRQICIEGLSHGQRYRLAFRTGLPSAVDEPLDAPVALDIYVQDRASMVRFTGDSFVLPGSARRGIPIVSVNTDRADLKLYRIGDRAIAPLLADSQFLTQLDGYSADRIESQSGEIVWQGTIDISPELNKDVVTSFPVDEALPERKPGIYVLTAAATNSRANHWDAKATQWFVVSDVGLTTYAGTDGLNVFARSLDSAVPLEGVELQLLARNNEVLGTATTDGQGRATFTAGLMRGTAAMTPAVILARKGASDFVFLDMTRAGFDLSDRGVTGRLAPGAIDVLVWTERGIYRAGETVHASALARDIEADAVEKLPLTFVFNRPDGVEDRRMVSDGAALGGHAVDLELQPNSMRGTWTMQVFADPKGQAIGEKQFLVDDFVPDRIEFDMTSEAKEIAAGEPAAVSVEGRYLYGAPGAGLEIEGDVALKPTRQSAAFPGYVFGLADEEAVEESRIPLEELDVLDDEGRTSFDVTLADLPATTQRLEALVTLRMMEAGGRAVERSLTLPVAANGPMIGVKPEFSGELGENSIANFHVVAVSPDGGKEEMRGLPWKLLSVERNYQWYRDGSSWRYEPVFSTTQVADGTVDVTAGNGGRISVPVTWGRYRLEVESPEADGPATSIEFDAGWYVAATSTETPDALEISLDKESYSVGDTARLKVSPRHAGQLLVTVGAESLIATQTAAIGAEGGEVEIPVTAEWGPGSYVTATLFRPGADQQSRMPMRAIGITWLKVDPAARKLDVALDVPEKTLPRQALEIALSVKGAGANEEAYVTVAAVDVGILNLTRYEAPDPAGWYFGQRRLGMEIRDLYGRLIDGSLGAAGRLRTGGDGGEGALQGKPPTEKLVAFFAGPVRLDADGNAKVSFDIPQFNGTARVMAVAWTKTGLGNATKDVVIRDPVVVTASLPKFLAPGDRADLRLDIANTDAPAGDYTLSVRHNASVLVEQTGADEMVRLEPGGKSALTLPLTGGEAGDGEITVTLADGAGLSLEQVLHVPVRPAAMPVTTRRQIEVAANGSLTLDGELLADSQLAGASVSLNVSRAAAFDVPALLMALDRYPYGCTEQTASRALPLLYLSELSAQSGLPEDTETRKRVQEAIYRVLANQSSTGSFGLWGPSYGDLWLDAFVTDFLSRAREQKFEVPEQAMVQAISNLQNALSYNVNVSEQGNEIAYALYVLARNRKAAISDLRYYADTKLADFRSPLARAQLAGALGLYGDAQRSMRIFADALSLSRDVTNVSLTRTDYGSSLRDGAAVLALAAESRPVPEIIPELAKIVARQWDAKRYTSTQEQTWMLLAARSMKDADKGLKLEVNGAARDGGYAAQMTGKALSDHPLTVANRTGEPVSAVLTTVAAPADPLPAGGDGFTIERRYYTLDGEEANVSDTAQNERYVAVLTVTEHNDWPSRIIVTDLLPAGFEIDNPSLVDSAKLANFDWLSEIGPAHTEFRYDRFVAAFNRSAGDSRTLTFAYVVRAVTPGVYDHPAAQVEDMYRPQFSARTATGRMQVSAGE